MASLIVRGAGGIGADPARARARCRGGAGIPGAEPGNRGGQFVDFGRRAATKQRRGAQPDRAMPHEYQAPVRRLGPERGFEGYFRADAVGIASGDADAERVGSRATAG